MTWPFENDTSAIVKKLAKRSLASEKRRNLMVVIAVALAAFLISFAAILSVSVAQIQRNQVADTYEAVFTGVDASDVVALKALPEFARVGEYYLLGQEHSEQGYNASYAEGNTTTASGYCSHVAGERTTAEYKASTAIGRYNVEYNPANNANSIGYYFVIGKGSSTTARANALRITATAAYGVSSWNASGADYAELFEWLDGNPDAEDRVGRFVTLDGEQIRLAGPEDAYILGIVSGDPSVVGNVHDDQWQGMFLYDIFGRPLWEDAEVPEELAPDGTVLIPAHVEHRQRLNPDYDGTQPYIPRTQRPEWNAVGLLGKLVAVDDGSCQVNGWAAVGENGIAAYSAQQTKYRVVARLDETHIRILIL